MIAIHPLDQDARAGGVAVGDLALCWPAPHLERLAQKCPRRRAAAWFADIVGCTDLSSRHAEDVG